MFVFNVEREVASWTAEEEKEGCCGAFGFSSLVRSCASAELSFDRYTRDIYQQHVEFALFFGRNFTPNLNVLDGRCNGWSTSDLYALG